jgi:hypothetical protein
MSPAMPRFGRPITPDFQIVNSGDYYTVVSKIIRFSSRPTASPKHDPVLIVQPSFASHTPARVIKVVHHTPSNHVSSVSRRQARY